MLDVEHRGTDPGAIFNGQQELTFTNLLTKSYGSKLEMAEDIPFKRELLEISQMRKTTALFDCGLHFHYYYSVTGASGSSAKDCSYFSRIVD